MYIYKFANCFSCWHFWYYIIIRAIDLFLILSSDTTRIVFSSLFRVLCILFIKSYNGHYLVLSLYSEMIYVTFDIQDVVIAYSLAYFTFLHHSMLFCIYIITSVYELLMSAVLTSFYSYYKQSYISIISVLWELLFDAWYIWISALFIIDTLIPICCACKTVLLNIV